MFLSLIALMLPMDARADWGGGPLGLILMGIGVLVVVFVMYHLWALIFYLPIAIFDLLSLLMRRKIRSELSAFAAGGFWYSVGIIWLLFVINFSNLKWYYCLTLSITSGIIFWYGVAFFMQYIEDKSGKN
jgi:hypothetical protein